MLSLVIGLNLRSNPNAEWISRSGLVGSQSVGNESSEIRNRNHFAKANANPVLSSSEFVALAEQIQTLRALPFNQPRSWTNRIAIESALIQMKELGVTSAADLPPGILNDTLGFLDPARRAEIEPLVASINNRIRDLEFDSLGRAMESEEVDTLVALEAERETMLEHILTTQEMTEWTARNSWESQQMRELPIALEPEQFQSAASIEHQFKKQADQLDLTTSEGINKLSKLGAWRDQELGQVLGTDTMVRLEKARQPGYAAMMEAGNAHGLPAVSSDYLWSLHRWQETTALQMAEGDWGQLTARQEEIREMAVQQLVKNLGESTAKEWMMSEAGSILAPPGADLLEPSIETPYPLTDGVVPSSENNTEGTGPT